ncbi:hypothetical protein R3P38DRAFT_3353324 [Favolaschia claudopus]|uniref:Uncharacterized protein n=1 Tax=Favolaschia claudopus TaxID=2862362 RepID=A0AAW0BTI7_9AGAR
MLDSIKTRLDNIKEGLQDNTKSTALRNKAPLKFFRALETVIESIVTDVDAIIQNRMSLYDIENAYPESLADLVSVPLHGTVEDPRTAFESEVDRVVCAHLSWFFPIQDDFYVAPQATYAAEISEDDAMMVIQEMWSTVQEYSNSVARLSDQESSLDTEPLELSVLEWDSVVHNQAEDFGEANTNALLSDPPFEPSAIHSTSTPKTQRESESAPQAGSSTGSRTIPLEEGEPEIPSSPASGPSTIPSVMLRHPTPENELPSRLKHAAPDFYKRLIRTIGRRRIRRPDFCVTYKRRIIAIVEDKLGRKHDAIPQLKRYMEELHESGPDALGIACVLDHHGSMMAMLKRTGPAQFTWLGGEDTWHRPDSPFVRAEMWKIRQGALGR